MLPLAPKGIEHLLLPAFLLVSGACQAQRDTVTVVSYNIRYDTPQDGADRWDHRKEALALFVREQRPAVIGLQEVLANQLSDLDTRWPGHARFGVGRDDGNAAGEHSPIYYDTARFALAEGRTLWLSPTPDSVSRGWDAACVRIATWAVLRDRQRGDSIWVVNTHWDHVGVEARRNSAALLLERLHPVLVAGKDVLLMGDLNATVEETSVRTLGQFLLSTCPDNRSAEGTYNGFGTVEPPLPRIDHVLISPTRWQVVAYDVPHPAVNDRQVSDHFPVVVRLLR
ncbi:MAG: endonuclease/exonuclease/phosphatase family protein [Flavobacteriales bacterium]|nr:endonuclease/exonuclease/phosphatase family protein [Flavobacteriales bacterium]